MCTFCACVKLGVRFVTTGVLSVSAGCTKPVLALDTKVHNGACQSEFGIEFICGSHHWLSFWSVSNSAFHMLCTVSILTKTALGHCILYPLKVALLGLDYACSMCSFCLVFLPLSEKAGFFFFSFYHDHIFVVGCLSAGTALCFGGRFHRWRPSSSNIHMHFLTVTPLTHCVWVGRVAWYHWLHCLFGTAHPFGAWCKVPGWNNTPVNIMV